MSDPPKRARGRPPIDPADPSVSFSLRIPAKDFEDATTRARDERVTLAEWIRRTLRGAAERDPTGDR
jgi:predicted HicB family RNase H-like nuclease